MKKMLAAIAMFVTVGAYANTIVGHDRARIINVEPITKQSYSYVPRQSCTQVERRSGADPVIGAIVGGAIGRNVAKDRDAGTVVGAIAGAVIADNNSSTRVYEECQTYRDKVYTEKIVGYNVTFDYRGQVRTTRFSRPPMNDYISIRTETRVYAME
jgi:uncharacterized protein YcfJ